MVRIATAELPESKLEAQGPAPPVTDQAAQVEGRQKLALLSRWKSDSLVCDGPNPAWLQPVRHGLQPLQLGGSAPEAPYRLAVAAGGTAT